MNTLNEFLLPDLGVRGAIVEFDQGIEAILGSRPYPPDVRRLLGQAIGAMPLLAANTRFEGRMSLQFQGQGALRMLVAQIDEHLQVRGMAKCSETASGDFTALMRGGLLGLLLEPRHGEHNYQAMVSIEGDSLAAALEHYYATSEQIPTRMRLACGEGQIRGVVLQRLPLGEKNSSETHWAHVCALLATLGEPELAQTDAPTLLRRLFHAETLRLFEPRPVALACRCSRQGIAAMLLSLGETEIDTHLAEHGRFEVTCEFCGRSYRFTAAEVAGLRTDGRWQPGSTTRH
ncbi:molecular chaperone Hsp33 [Fontimonas thermophila]|uniref:Molecular chaperone Hsp33 n=1 Tax=Fontimonas thermophila TaxID=1076937 RepID=A0A1I2IZW3_9GAMM|nr:Hsp33 family molecular chaperone HslO [Fontimonas thermophila]SFF47123.1 molecular chaperone Hsp33 [Fontimonas thermophila]